MKFVFAEGIRAANPHLKVERATGDRGMPHDQRCARMDACGWRAGRLCWCIVPWRNR
jgi:hypothetical protein